MARGRAARRRGGRPDDRGRSDRRPVRARAPGGGVHAGQLRPVEHAPVPGAEHVPVRARPAQWSAGLAAYGYTTGWAGASDDRRRGRSSRVVAGRRFQRRVLLARRPVQRLWARRRRDTPCGHWASRVSPRADGVFLVPAICRTPRDSSERGRRHHDLARRLVVGYSAANPNNPRLRGVIAVSSFPWATTAGADRYKRASSAAFPRPGRRRGHRADLLRRGRTAARSARAGARRHLARRAGAAGGAGATSTTTARKGRSTSTNVNQAIGPTYLGRIGDGTIRPDRGACQASSRPSAATSRRTSTPPGPDSPACVKRTPPPWAVPPTM